MKPKRLMHPQEASGAPDAPHRRMPTRTMQLPRFAGRAGLATSVLVAVAALGGIVSHATYAHETASWRAQGIAQDWVDLLLAAPWLAIASVLALRGSRRGALLLGGAFAYTAYSFVLYAFAVHFNALFLVYVTTLGLSLYGLLDLARSLGGVRVHAWFDDRAPRRLVGATLIGFAGMFTLLWLAQIVPAILNGTTPPELEEVALATNPVHILDLAIVLPLMFVAGRRLRRRTDAGFALGVILLGFSVLMDAAILAMTIALRGSGVLVVAFAALATYVALLLGLMLRAMRAPRAHAS
jgi:hypothetical protein